MSVEFNFNNNVSGSGAQINQGQNVTATQTNQGDQAPAVERVIEYIGEALPKEIAEPITTEIQTLAALPIAEQQQPETQAKLLAVCEQIKPHAGTIWRNIAIFGATALDTLAKRNPVIAGIVEVCRANTQPEA